MSDEAYLAIIAVLIVLNAYLFIRMGSKTKYDGELIVTTDPESGKKIFSLEIGKTPEEIEIMKSIAFSVKSQDND